MNTKADSFNLPIALITFTLKHKVINQLQLYMALKIIYPDGQFIFNRYSRKKVSQYIGYKTPKTFDNNMKWLIKNKWLTFRKGHCIIKSFKKLHTKYHFHIQKGVVFIPQWDMPKFRAFLYGAVIKYYMEKKSKQERRSGVKKGCSYMKRNPVSVSFPSFHTLPNTYLAKILGISKSSASNYRRIANEAGYIDAKHDYSFYPSLDNFPRKAKKYIDNSDINRIRFINNKFCLQNPDKISSDMIIKQKRNLRYRKFN